MACWSQVPIELAQTDIQNETKTVRIGTPGRISSRKSKLLKLALSSLLLARIMNLETHGVFAESIPSCAKEAQEWKSKQYIGRERQATKPCF